MLLKRIEKQSYRMYIVIGQLSLVFGILLTRLSQAAYFQEVTPSFYQGLIVGISGVMIGVSIVFNVQSLRYYRESKKTQHLS